MVPTFTPEAIAKTLKERGLRVTPQRLAVYANLLQRQDHPNAEEIFNDLNHIVPRSSQATVYSSLRTLLDVGLIREVLLEEGVCRYDANTNPHHHFRCKCCGTITDIAWEQFPGLTPEQMPPQLQVEQYEIILQGVCDCCQG